MTARRWYLIAVGALLVGGGARAAVDCPSREGELTHVCDANNQTCTPDFPSMPAPVCTDTRPSADCPDSKCSIDFVTGPMTSFRGVLTVVVDDSVEQMVRTPTGTNIVAVSVALDLGKKGVISQIYQDTSDPTSPPTDFYGLNVSELIVALQDDVDDNTGKLHGINDLVFRGLDDQMSSALRALYNVAAGTAVFTKITGVQVTDQQTTGLGTVLRAKVKGGFVQP